MASPSLRNMWRRAADIRADARYRDRCWSDSSHRLGLRGLILSGGGWTTPGCSAAVNSDSGAILGNWEKPALSAVITFATISAIGGLVLGFYCVPWPLIVIPNLIIAIVSVIMSLHQNLSFLAAVALFFDV